MSIYPAPLGRVESTDGLAGDEKNDVKSDAFATTVQAVPDLESAGEPIKGDVVPEGVDPNLMRTEQVHRGLKQRHIQVSRVYRI
jgi:amino acid permease